MKVADPFVCKREWHEYPVYTTMPFITRPGRVLSRKKQAIIDFQVDPKRKIAFYLNIIQHAFQLISEKGLYAWVV